MLTISTIPNLFRTEITPKIKQDQRRKVANGFYNISREYHKGIPIVDIEDVLSQIGYHLIQEDGTPWSGIFCGEEGSCYLQIANEDGDVPNNLVCLQWYKLTTKYEINVYLS